MCHEKINQATSAISHSRSARLRANQGIDTECACPMQDFVAPDYRLRRLYPRLFCREQNGIGAILP